MILDYYGVLKEIRSFVGNSNLGLQFDPNCEVPNTDGRTVYVPPPNPSWSEDAMIRWRASVYHETGHNDPDMRDLFDLIRREKIDMRSLVGMALNIVDDYRQEKHKLGTFIGRDQCLSMGNASIIKNKILDGGERAPEMPELQDGMIASVMMSWTTAYRENWQKHTAGLGLRWADELLNTKQREFFDRLMADFDGRLDALKTAEDELELVLEILASAGRNADEEMEKAKAARNGKGQKQEGDGSSQKADGQSSGSGDSEDGGGGADGEAKAGQGEEDGEATGGVVKYEDILIHNHADEEQSAGYRHRPGSYRIDYDGYESDAGFEIDTNPTIRDFTNDAETGRGNLSAEVRQLDVSNGLPNKVRALLQVKTQSINVYGQKKGRIANKNIHRASFKNSGGYQQRIFSRKEQAYDLDVAVSVLIDFSGSMTYGKIAHAAKSAMMLNDAIARIGVPVEVLGFTDRQGGIFNIIKTFDSRDDSESLLSRMDAAASRGMHYNADGEAVLFAYNRLIRRKEKRKILIVLSDGQPASSRGDADALTKRVVKDIEKKRKAELYAIGIMDGSVSRYYQNHRVIHHANELEAALLGVVKDYILS